MCQDAVWGLPSSDFDYLIVERDQNGTFGKAHLAIGFDRKTALQWAVDNTSLRAEVGSAALIVPVENASNYQFHKKTTVEHVWEQNFEYHV